MTTRIRFGRSSSRPTLHRWGNAVGIQQNYEALYPIEIEGERFCAKFVYDPPTDGVPRTTYCTVEGGRDQWIEFFAMLTGAMAQERGA